MITEGIVALVWAAVGSYFFFDPASGNTDLTVQAPQVVEIMSKRWLGVFGGTLAILGVVAAPITTGDTSLRSVRLIIADFLKIQTKETHIASLHLNTTLYCCGAYNMVQFV